MKIDLHGYTVHDGWREFRVRVEKCYYNGIKSVVVVTGHGIMQKEIYTWCRNSRYISRVEEIPHNTGAVRVYLNKSKRYGPHTSEPESDMRVLVKKLQDKYK